MEKDNTGRGVVAAGVARKWEGERRCQVPRSPPSQAAIEFTHLTERMYDSGRGEANGKNSEGSQKPEAASQKKKSRFSHLFWLPASGFHRLLCACQLFTRSNK